MRLLPDREFSRSVSSTGAPSRCRWPRSAAPSALFLWNIFIPAQLPGAGSLQPALPRFPWSSPLGGPDSCSFVSLRFPPASPWPLCLRTLFQPGESVRAPPALCGQQRDPEPCRRGRNQILCHSPQPNPGRVQAGKQHWKVWVCSCEVFPLLPVW